ncbi:hypothetical protein L0V05_16085 [Tabrizicola sp. J26]|uniref:hypothetical protein n=1 Tax=Alitabrizicola rongguiensis TaxID=2909234 RepID=UPI001F15DE85|nr:hypothetical protein [Tabrizicola rongguiensis]MCF1710331.1 hypothetical protein [Tabrizicola rongguiensis]
MQSPQDSQEVVSPVLDWTRQQVRREILGDGGQQAEVRLEVEFQLYSWRQKLGDPAKKFLLVSLQGSTANPLASGGLMWNRDDRRGWYNHGVIIEMEWEKATEDEVWIKATGPDTTAQQGASSVTSSIDFNIGAGTFGGTPTTNASVGGSISNSWTVSLEDFAVRNLTANNKVKHVYKLHASKGGPYEEPEDLVDRSASGAFSGVFDGKAPGALFKLPDRAISSMDLASQVLFETRTGFAGKRRLFVTMELQCCWVEKTYRFVDFHVEKQFQSVPAIVDADIDFGSVD